MDEHQKSVAMTCLEAADSNRMTFPQIVGTLMQEGFESYMIDFRRAAATYYLPDGDSVDLPAHRIETAITPAFDAARVEAAIREAQQLVPGYTYRGFCEKVAAAGCAGYMVSIAGQRAVYYGRTGENHVERFPGARP